MHREAAVILAGLVHGHIEYQSLSIGLELEASLGVVVDLSAIVIPRWTGSRTEIVFY